MHLLLAVFGYPVNVGILKRNAEMEKAVWVLQFVRWLDWAACSAMCNCFGSMSVDHRIVFERFALASVAVFVLSLGID